MKAMFLIIILSSLFSLVSCEGGGGGGSSAASTTSAIATDYWTQKDLDIDIVSLGDNQTFDSACFLGESGEYEMHRVQIYSISGAYPLSLQYYLTTYGSDLTCAAGSRQLQYTTTKDSTLSGDTYALVDSTQRVTRLFASAGTYCGVSLTTAGVPVTYTDPSCVIWSGSSIQIEKLGTTTIKVFGIEFEKQ
jgi:hypothetical protein